MARRFVQSFYHADWINARPLILQNLTKHKRPAVSWLWQRTRLTQLIQRLERKEQP